MAKFKRYDMSKSQMDIFTEYIHNAKEIIKTTGIDIGNLDDLNLALINSHRTLGVCTRDGKNISLSKQYFEYCLKNGCEKDLQNTVIHELLHAVCSRKRHYGHTGLWKIYAEKVSRKTEYKITRLANDKEWCNSDERNERRKCGEYKYLVRCGNCGKEYKYKSYCKAIRYIMSGNPTGYHCTCGSKMLTVIS